MSTKAVFEENGFTLTLTEVFNKDNLKGVFSPNPLGQIDDGIFYITFIYTAMSREELDVLSEKNAEEITEADLTLVRSRQGRLAAVYSINVGILSAENTAILEKQKERMTEFAQAGDITYYRVNPDEDTEEFLSRIAPEYREEYRALQAALDDALKNAEFYAPVIPGEELIGKAVRFDATDLDGNPVRSEDIFRDHEITMINLWATWCHNCIGEMTGLGEMARRLAGRNVAVVGICTDADDKLKECRAILKEHSVDFLNLMPVENLEELLAWQGSLPTSYFFGSDGKLLCLPFRGAPTTVDEYEEVINSLLVGKEVTVKAPDSPDSTANSEGVYRVIVSDNDGNPIQGVKVQFCSDFICMMETTDENGTAVFNAEEGSVYSVHVLKVPEGYEEHTGEYAADDTCCEVCISLKKAP